MKQNLFNKLWLRVGMIVAIMTTALAGTAAAETETITFPTSSANVDMSSSGVSVTGTHVSVTISTGTGANLATNTDGTRIYNGNSMVFTSTDKKISKIVFAYKRNKKQSNGVSANSGLFTTAFTVGNTQASNLSATWEASDETTTTVTFTVGSGSGNYALQSAEVTFVEAGVIPTPSLSVSPDAIAFGVKAINNSYQETFEVNFAHLTENLTVSGFSGVTVSPTTISKDATGSQTVTVTYAPTAEGSINGNITVGNTADAVSETVAVTGSAYDPSNLTYYEKVTSAPSDWTGDYIFTGINSGNYYALTGVSNNLGTTAQVTVTEDGIASTSTTDAYKVTIAETTNGYSLYMDGVGYLSYSGTKNELHASNDFSANTCEWTISFASGVATITNVDVDGRMLQFNYNNGNPRFACYTSSQVKLTLFKLNDGTPSISADDVDITYDAEEGEIEYTIGNPVNGGSLVASTTADWLTVDDAAKTASTGTIEFVCDSNPTGTQRTAEVTLTYTYNTNEILTKTVVITQAGNPDALVTIAEARAQTGTVKTKGIVTSCVGTTAFIQDATAAICVYGSELTVGDEVRVIGTITTYKGLIEITDPAVTVLSQNNTVTPEVMTIAQVIASTKQGWFVKIEDATVKVIDSSNSHNNTIAQGENTITLHGNLGDVEENDIITFNGNIGCFTNVQLVNPTDVTVTGTVTPTTYTLSWTAGEHTELFVFNAAGTANPLTSGDDIAPGTTIQVSVDVASGYELESLVVDGNDVTDQIDATGVYEFVMPSHNVAITSSATASSVTPTSTASVTFDFSDTGWGFPENYTTTEGLYTNGGYTITLSEVTSGGHKALMSSGQNPVQVGLIFGKTGASLALPAFSFNVKKIIVYGNSGASTTVTENIFVGDEAVSTEVTSAATNHEFEIDDNYQETGNVYILKLTNTNKNSQVTKIEVFGYESVEVTSAGYATYCSENALDFTNTDIKAYVGKKNGDKLTFTPIDQVPANTGMLLVYAGGKTENVPVIASATAVEGNCLVGVNAQTTISSNDYILNKVNDGVGFYKAGTFTTLGAHKAYIPAAVGNGVKGFAIDLEDDATGISLMEDGRSQMEDGAIYNVAGQRISKMQKGINIVNGKKILK